MKGKLKYIKKYKVDLEVLSRSKSELVKELIIDVLKDYFLEGSIPKIKEVKMTKNEIENWIDFDEKESD